MEDYKGRVNEEGVYTIVKKDNEFATKFIEFNFDERLEKQIIDLRKLLGETSEKIKNNKISFEECKDDLQDKIDDLIKKVKDEYPDFFQVRYYVDDIHSPYQKMIDFSFSGWNEITGDSERILEVSYYILMFLISYKHALLQKSLKAMGTLAYSHRVAGFHGNEFKMDDNFKTIISTNFGYGRASYFAMTISYKNIPIIPYTAIIYYLYANASTVLHFTRNYPLGDSSWISCFDFTVEELNTFYKQGAASFISQYIVKTLDELIELLDSILKNDTFYFVSNLNKLNTLLGIKNKHIVYDYEHLLENENPNAINQEKLQILVEEVRKIPPDKYGWVFDYEVHINARSVLNRNAINTNDEFLMARYYYAIATVLSKNIQLDEWDTGSHNVVTRLMNLVIRDHKTLVYKKAGFNLISFRNERIILSLKLIKNLGSMNSIIDSNGYIKKISNLANLLLQQNDQFLCTLVDPIKDARNKYEKALKKYGNYKSEFEASGDYRKYTWFKNTYDIIGTFLRNYFNPPDKQEPESFIAETLLELTDIYTQIKDNPIMSRSEFFALSDYKNNNSRNDKWSIKRFRDIYSSDPTKVNQKNKGISIKFTKTICEIVVLFDYDQESNFNKKQLIRKIVSLKSIFKKMTTITKGDSYGYERSLINFFFNAAEENNEHYIKYREHYAEGDRNLTRLLGEKNEMLKELNKLEEQEENIKSRSQQIKELKK